MALSPGLAFSTASLRRMMSMLRGIEPDGISDGFSCTLTRCQSANSDCSTLSCHLNLFMHWLLLHAIGCVDERVVSSCCAR
jgi:hypothetical protein